jgi:hypothetical protein
MVRPNVELLAKLDWNTLQVEGMTTGFLPSKFEKVINGRCSAPLSTAACIQKHESQNEGDQNRSDESNDVRKEEEHAAKPVEALHLICPISSLWTSWTWTFGVSRFQSSAWWLLCGRQCVVIRL